jgi:predicted nucleic acid-binding protein
VTVLIDSDILIEVSGGRILRSPAVERTQPLGRGHLYSAVSVPYRGRAAGDYLRQYRKSHGVELGDALVAASAATHRAVLWTRNRKRYPMSEVALF